MKKLKKLITAFKGAKKTVVKKIDEVVEQVTPAPKPPRISGIYNAVCIDQARNPQWIYVRIEGIDGKVAAVIPRRLTGKLVGKRVKVEAITDETGTSYRYIQEPI